MKKPGLTITIILLAACKLFSQSLGHDNTGNSPVVFPAGHVSVDVPSTLVSASYHHISNNQYRLTNGMWGLSLTGRERAGLGSLLNYGPTATEISAAFTGGISFANEYINKYKPQHEYKAMLEYEEAAAQKRLLLLRNDTAWLNDNMRGLLINYPLDADTLRTIYLEAGPDRKILFSKWREYARTVPDEADGEKFRIQLNGVIEKMQFDPVFSEYNQENEVLGSVQKQLQNINTPAKPFKRTILYARVGMRAMSYNTVRFFKRSFTDSTAAFEKKTAEFAMITIGASHHINNQFFLGYSFGLNVQDNFEKLEPLTVDTSKGFMGASGNVEHAKRVYTGELKKIDAPFFSVQFSFVADAGKNAKMLVTPLYFTFSAKTVYGASLQVITSNKFTAGLNIQQMIGDDGEITINELSFGFRLGYLLADFDFGN